MLCAGQGEVGSRVPKTGGGAGTGPQTSPVVTDNKIPCKLVLLEQAPTGDLVHAIRVRVEPFNGVELEIQPREPMREPVNFDS